MKAEDLMVGDWVHYKMNLGKDGIYEKDIQIQNIYGNEVNCELKGYEIISGKFMSFLEPIPLTSEILEKNGWCVKGAYSTLWLDAENTLMLEYYPHLNSLRKIYIHKDFSEEIVFRCDAINYVHQFQHALKLCGIDLEIKV